MWRIFKNFLRKKEQAANPDPKSTGSHESIENATKKPPQEKKLEIHDKKPDHSDIKSGVNQPKRVDHYELEKNYEFASNVKPNTSDDPGTSELNPDKRKWPARRYKWKKDMEYPPRDSGVAEIQPWEIDENGVLLSEKIKHRKLTAYEKWLHTKWRKDEHEIICPECGHVNYEYPLVSGQKCGGCGFILDDAEEIFGKIERYAASKSKPVDRLVGKYTKQQLEASLAVPAIILQNPDADFDISFRTYSNMFRLVYIAACVAGILILRDFSSEALTQQRFWYFGAMALIGFVIILIFADFIREASLSCIRVTKAYAIFYSAFGWKRINYDKITSITNERTLSGFGRLLSGDALIPISIIMPSSIYSSTHERAGTSVSDGLKDNSSSSREYMNNIMISSPENSVSFSFSGGGNAQFVQALAIIIHCTRKLNNKCLITPSAMIAAEKGYEYYSRWKSREKQSEPPEE